MEEKLQHYGVLGMKWGRRKTGTPSELSTRTKKKIEKKYIGYSNKAINNVNKKYNDIWLDSYNKTVNDMNDGGIDKFNESQKKKYGKDFAKRDGYDDDYMVQFNNKVDKLMNKKIVDTMKNDHAFKKSKELIDKYQMTSWSELVKENIRFINEFE